jgi:hypothetical protein
MPRHKFSQILLPGKFKSGKGTTSETKQFNTLIKLKEMHQMNIPITKPANTV